MQEIDIDYEKLKENHKEIVEVINDTLPSNVAKVEINENIGEGLDNDEIEETIKIAQDLKAKRETQLKIYEQFKADYPNYNSRTMGDFIYSSFMTQNNDAARKYNKALFEDYLANPDKYIFKHYNKLLEVEARDLTKLKTPLDYAKFYRDHYEAVEMSSVAASNANLVTVSYKIRQNLPTLNRFFKLVEYSKRETEKYESPEMIALPKLTKEQATALKNVIDNRSYEPQEYLKKGIDLAVTEDQYIAPKKYLEDLSRRISKPQEVKKKYTDPNTNQAKYKIVRKEPSKDAFKNTKKFMVNFVATKKESAERIDIDKYTYPGEDTDFKLNIVNGPKKLDVECVTDSFKEKYLEAWQSRFVKQRGKTGFYSIEQIKSENSGNIVERIRNTTSQQYKDMIKALEDFEDENSAGYLDYANLKAKAEAYLEHKYSQGYGRTKKFTGTPLLRKNLAEAIISMEKKHDDVFNEAKKDYLANEIEKPVVQVQVFNDQKELEDNPVEKDNEIFVIGAQEIKELSGVPHNDIESAIIEDYMDKDFEK